MTGGWPGYGVEGFLFYGIAAEVVGVAFPVGTAFDIVGDGLYDAPFGVVIEGGVEFLPGAGNEGTVAGLQAVGVFPAGVVTAFGSEGVPGGDKGVGVVIDRAPGSQLLTGFAVVGITQFGIFSSLGGFPVFPYGYV